jgi:hypothetical protein
LSAVGILQRIGSTISPTLPQLRAAGSVAIPSGSALVSIPTDVLEAFGVHTGGTVTRAKAMGIPAMRRGRQIIAGTLGTLPLQALRRPARGQLEPVDSGTTASFLAELDPRTTTQWTLTWTVDDLLFHGISWWRVLTVDAYGWPRTAERLAPGRVQVSNGVAYIDGRKAPEGPGVGSLIRFDGPDAGVLVDGIDPLRTCLLLEAAVRRNSTGLPPMDLLTPKEGAEDLTEAEVQELLGKWGSYREDSGTGYLGATLDHRVVGFDPRAGQLAEARQHQALEVARMLNLDAQEVNAPAGSGMTYANTEAKRRDLIDVSLGLYMTAVAQRLSMPDVTPRGQLVRMDTTGFIRGTTADAITAAVAASGGPVMTPEESREGLLGLPGTPSQGQLRTTPTPAPAEESA